MKEVQNHFVKFKRNGHKLWGMVQSIDHKAGMLLVRELEGNHRSVYMPCSEIIAYYQGKVKDIEGLAAPYVPVSDTCTILNTIVPDSMDYETHIAARKVQEIIGEKLNSFVERKLKYNNLELCKALAAEQVDAVGLAIYNIEVKRQGMIIGDQTGIGKGRVAAAMIRYGVLNGMKPIFLSEKPNLFSDIYRDLSDIGSASLVPFIINGKESKTDIKDMEGNVVYQALPAPEQSRVFKSGKFPSGYDYGVATYTQFSSPKDRPEKANFLRAISNNNLLVMDEAHNASGSSNTGEFLQEVIGHCKGVVFLSATFAKRPDNMPIYAMKTCISECNMSKEDMVDAIKKGGVALQEVLSAQLVSEAQMIRRERSFDGVEVNYHILTEKEQEHKAIYDGITEVLRDIIAFQDNFITGEVDQMDTIAAAEGKETEERKGTSKAGVDNLPYFSKVFQVVNQMLFSIKAKSVAELAIQRLEQGKKPIIAFSSTMESFVESLHADDGRPVQPGDTISIDYKTVLQKGLDGVLRYTITDTNGGKEYKTFSMSELKKEAQDEYTRILDKIKTISTGISISPIDIVKETIRAAGYSCEEVTGRKYEIQLVDGTNTGVLLNRKRINTNDAFRMFNNNEIDCLLINQAGATGASAHAIVTPKVPSVQVKQRAMIILQPELDINREVQKRGRINRTGQIYKPIYDYVSSAIPAERRLMMMLRRKLKSLDANTTSNQKQSENLLNVDDFLNKYGDRIVTDYMIENPELHVALGKPLSNDKDEIELKEGAASKVSGRVAVLSTVEQEKFYADILELYGNYVEYLRQTGEYDLEVEAMNLEAEAREIQTIIEGKNGTSVFSENSTLEKCDVNVLKKPFSYEELKSIIADNLKGREAMEIQEELKAELVQYYSDREMIEVDELNKKYDKLIAEIPSEREYKKIADAKDREIYVRNRTVELNGARSASIEKKKETIRNMIQYLSDFIIFYYIGRGLNYPTMITGQYSKAVCIGYDINRKRANPFAPSAIKVKLAVSDSTKYIVLSMSGDTAKKLHEIMGVSWSIKNDDEIIENWTYHCKNSNVNRRTAFIITGNILQAFSKFTGKLISFTTNDGSIRKGILLPENYDPKKATKGDTVIVPIAKAKEYIMQGNDVTSSDGKILIEGSGFSSYPTSLERYRIMMPATKQFRDVFADQDLMNLTSNPRDGFEKRGSQMVARIGEQNIGKVIDLLQSRHSLAIQMSTADYDKYISKRPGIDKKDDLTRKAEQEYEKDKARHTQVTNTEKPSVKAKPDMNLLKLKLKLKAKALELNQ